ncbi:hypothetical protein ALI144C_39345 [Actinosynnema sp. ALI-1.44]|uniref:hypothetical protein n=1 Tax=Actinosynnema sp. ALI-1.44 TaxID=1933779 RepID=UPI00097C7166|nr:hypothetical protein [Actinosynnema sp. ALI-1.44]ONI74849.1 hypothetical protein ALI144C_39345 [Actinosynnema sp. ALI-1.44]
MATELDPQRLLLVRELTKHVMPWVVAKAFDTDEIQSVVEYDDTTTQDQLGVAAREARNAVVTAGTRACAGPHGAHALTRRIPLRPVHIRAQASLGDLASRRGRGLRHS